MAMSLKISHTKDCSPAIKLLLISLSLPLAFSICVPQIKDFTTPSQNLSICVLLTKDFSALDQDSLGFVHLCPSASFETMMQKNNLLQFVCWGSRKLFLFVSLFHKGLHRALKISYHCLISGDGRIIQQPKLSENAVSTFHPHSLSHHQLSVLFQKCTSNIYIYIYIYICMKHCNAQLLSFC